MVCHRHLSTRPAVLLAALVLVASPAASPAQPRGAKDAQATAAPTLPARPARSELKRPGDGELLAKGSSGTIDLGSVAGKRFDIEGLKVSIATAGSDIAASRNHAAMYRKAFYSVGKVELLNERATSIGAAVEEMRPVAPGDEENGAEVEAATSQLRSALTNFFEGTEIPDEALLAQVVDDLRMALQSGTGRLDRTNAELLGRDITALLSAASISTDDVAALLLDAEAILMGAGCEPEATTAFVESLLAMADLMPAASLPPTGAEASSRGGATGLKGGAEKAPRRQLKPDGR